VTAIQQPLGASWRAFLVVAACAVIGVLCAAPTWAEDGKPAEGCAPACAPAVECEPYKPCVECWDPRIAVGFDYASGDSNPADGDVGTFNQLFPLAHKYLGHADLLGRQNVVAARLEAHVKPAKKLTLSAWYHMFWRAEESDAAYAATGGVLRAAGGSTETAIGSELDIMLKYAIDRHWVAFAEWAHFFTGDFLTGTGADEDVDVIYLSIQGTF
jgi:hypothetical protein